MLLRRCASACSRWRQNGEMLLLARSASGSTAKEDLNLAELQEQQKTSVSNIETMFGITPIRTVDKEDEDFVTPGMPMPPPPPAPQNYFSKTWKMQKGTPLTDVHGFLDQQPIPPSQCAESIQLTPTNRSIPGRIWRVPSDLQACIHGTFKFASLKVLSTAILYGHRRSLYKRVPFNLLDWKSRKRRVLADLDQLSADIICLQELDMFQDLKSDLALRGYTGLYKVSNRQASCGCAIFWKQKRFKLLYEESIDFSLLGMKDNVAQLCVLELIVPETQDHEVANAGNGDHGQRKCLLVGNIDALFNPKRGEYKLGQCRTFLQRAGELLDLWPGTDLVIGGCFHVTPQSAIYRFIAESKLDVSGLDPRYLSGHFEKPAQFPQILSGSPLTSQRSNSADKVDPSQRLSSLLAESKAKQSTCQMHLVDTARLSTSSNKIADGCLDLKHAAAVRASISRTAENLESSRKSQGDLKACGENVSGVEVSPGISELLEPNTDSNTASKVEDESVTGMDASETNIDSKSMDSKSRKTSGSMMELVSSATVTLHNSSAEDGDPGRDCVVTSDVALDKVSSIINSASMEPSEDSAGQSSTPEHGWDLEALRIATGSQHCSVVKHDLELFSVYPEILGEVATRGSKAEPCFTMVHEEFVGTVDYIWRSKGLKTMKVLDTYPWSQTLRSPMLPFLVSGSDHVSLACELGFCSS